MVKSFSGQWNLCSTGPSGKWNLWPKIPGEWKSGQKKLRSKAHLVNRTLVKGSFDQSPVDQRYFNQSPIDQRFFDQKVPLTRGSIHQSVP